MTTIDGDRLWQSLMDMARLGATPEGGSHREALTDADKAGRDLFAAWCAAEGCAARPVPTSSPAPVTTPSTWRGCCPPR
jgi:hypothetical protein